MGARAKADGNGEPTKLESTLCSKSFFGARTQATLTSSVFWRLGQGVVTPTKPFAIHMLVYATMAPNDLDLGFRD